MNTSILIFLNLFLIGFESIMTAYLANCFFSRRYNRWIYALAIFILFTCSSLYILSPLGDNTILRMLTGIVLHTVWISIVFRVNVIKAAFTSLLLMSFWGTADNLVLLCASIIIGDSTLFSESPYAYYLMCFCAKGLELLGITVLGAFIRHRFMSQMSYWSDWLRTIFFPASVLLISTVLFHMFFQAPGLELELVLCAGILLLADMMSVFLLEYLEKQQVAIRNNAILQQNLKTERESIASWITAYKEERKRSHEFQNQLSVLRGMAEEQAPANQFIQYLDSLLNTELPATRYINTNRPVADVLLSQKAAIAKDKNISFQMQLDNLSNFPLSDDELVVVLANLLDNAIEACELIHTNLSRYILIKIQCKPTVTYLYIENPTSEPVTIKNNCVVASRKNTFSHGFGLQNVSTILKKHQAIYSIDYRPDEHIFCFSAQLTSN